MVTLLDAVHVVMMLLIIVMVCRIQIGMFRPIRVDHTNCLQVAIKTHSFRGVQIRVGQLASG
jgi:hypothetical protein